MDAHCDKDLKFVKLGCGLVKFLVWVGSNFFGFTYSVVNTHTALHINITAHQHKKFNAMF